MKAKIFCKKSAVALITGYGFVSLITPILMTAEFLAQKGYHVDIFFTEAEHCKKLGIPYPKFNNQNIRVFSNDEILAPIKNISYPKHLKINHADLAFISKFLKPPTQYEFIIGYDPSGLGRTGILSQYWDVPYLYHSLEIDESTGIEKDTEKWFSKRALLTLISGEKRADIISELNNIDRKKIEIVHNSTIGKILPQKKDYFRKKFGISKNKRIVLATGTLIPGTSIDKIIKSTCNWPNDFVLVLHGWISEKEFGPFIFDSIESCNGKIFLSDEVLDPNEKFVVFQSVDIGLVFFEPIDINYKFAAESAGKLFDFMRAGVPVIGNDIPGMYELIEGNACGIVVEDASKIGGVLNAVENQYELFQKKCLDSFVKYEFTECYEKVLQRIYSELP